MNYCEDCGDCLYSATQCDDCDIFVNEAFGPITYFNHLKNECAESSQRVLESTIGSYRERYGGYIGAPLSLIDKFNKAEYHDDQIDIYYGDGLCKFTCEGVFEEWVRNQKHYHEELIAAALHPCRMQAKIDESFDMEAFFECV